jgi:hypothetical protein
MISNTKPKSDFDRLARMRDELKDIKMGLLRLDKTKIDRVEFTALTQRLTRLEQEFANYKNTAPAKTN